MKTKHLFALIAWMTFSIPAFADRTYDYLNTPNRFINVSGVKFSYRILGKPSKYPLVLLQHYLGSMDNWDPELINELAKQRTIIVFDNKGVCSSEGVVPNTFEAMGDDAANFIMALGYKQVDVLGFSIGGAEAQTLTLQHPELVHKLILAGTAPKGSTKINHRDPKLLAIMAHPTSESQFMMAAFYAQTPLSQQLGNESLERRAKRVAYKENPISQQGTAAQTKARMTWGAPADSTFAYLKKITIPVLVTNGSDDIMMFTDNSYILYQNLPDARLILYPDSGHGFLFQYPVQFAKDAGDFLDHTLN